MNIETNIATITEMQTQMDKMMDGGFKDVCLDKNPRVLHKNFSWANTVRDVVCAVDIEDMNEEFSPDKKVKMSCTSGFHTVKGSFDSILRFFILEVESAGFMMPIIMDIHQKIYATFSRDMFNEPTKSPYRWVVDYGNDEEVSA